MSKGSKPRPVDMDVYRDNFDRIFGGKTTKKRKPKVPPDLNRDLKECRKIIDQLLLQQPLDGEQLDKYYRVENVILSEIKKYER